jgi:hypothetical protein
MGLQNAGRAALRRSGHRQWILKPQDLAVALKPHLLERDRLSYAELAAQLRLSSFEVHAAVQRLVAARLAAVVNGAVVPVRPSLRSFIVNRAPFVYPAVRGEITIGTPTAHAVPPLQDLMVAGNELPPVWPDPSDQVRAESVQPLHPRLPEAAKADPRRHQLLALFDSLRIGLARERSLASEELDKCLI